MLLPVLKPFPMYSAWNVLCSPSDSFLLSVCTAFIFGSQVQTLLFREAFTYIPY